MMKRKLGPAVMIPLGLLWLGGVGLASRAVMDDERRAGPETVATGQWPAASGLRLDGPTLVMVAHPKCPCTAASLDQLADVASRVPFRGYLLFVRPDDLPTSWAHNSLWSRSSEIPGLTPIDDPGGRLADLFGGATSGQVFLYDRQGALRFSGGITPGRGVSGDSAGRDSLLAWLRNGAAQFARTPVYGCPVASR